jgi:hypothetical protein
VGSEPTRLARETSRVNSGQLALPVPPRPPKPTATVRYPRLVPKDAACAKVLKKRPLTNLYNQRPQWLALAHDKLDAAVFAAYDWPATLTDELLAKLLALNLSRSAPADRSP